MIPDQAVKVEASEWQVDPDIPRSASDVNLVESGKNGGRTVSGVELRMKVFGWGSDGDTERQGTQGDSNHEEKRFIQIQLTRFLLQPSF